jgi:hypothetical protein
MGRRPIGQQAMTDAERMRRYRANRRAAKPPAESASDRRVEEIAKLRARLAEVESKTRRASYAPSYLADDLPEDVLGDFGFVHGRGERVPWVKESRSTFRQGEGAARVRVWMEKITDETHVRCKCSVPCTSYIATCAITGAVDLRKYPHYVPRAETALPRRFRRPSTGPSRRERG